MRIIDISVPLRAGMPTYPGDPPFVKAVARSRAAGDAVEVAALTLGSHAGTHVDVPFHFVAGGADLSATPLAPFIGPASVVAAPGVRAVGAAAVEALVPPGVERVLFRTDNSALWARDDFVAEYAYLAADGARALVARGVTLVGWDYLSVEAFGAATAETHQTLLGAGVMILEGLTLTDVTPGTYFLAALPLAIAAGDGSPVRAVLLEGWAG
jgi:arylformamidase